MKKTTVLYVFDPLCGWCFGFSGVMKRLATEFAAYFSFDIISGGMITGERAGILEPRMAAYILETIPRLEEYTGARFGEPYKQQIAEGTLYQSSVKPSIALGVFKTYYPGKGIEFAAAMQQAQFVEGKSFEDDETYIALLKPYGIPPTEFIEKMNSAAASDAVQQEFAYAHELGVTGFPAVLAIHDEKYYQVARGYQPYETLKPVFEKLKSFN